MQINITQKLMQEGNREVKGSTFIAPNLIKKSERLDRFGNVIDPRTKQIIEPVTEEKND